MSQVGQVGPGAGEPRTPFEGDSQFLPLSENEGKMPTSPHITRNARNLVFVCKLS